MITLTPSEVLVKDTEPGLYVCQLDQPLTGTETVTVIGGGFTLHAFDLNSTGPESGFTLQYSLEQITFTAANNAGDLLLGFKRVAAL